MRRVSTLVVAAALSFFVTTAEAVPLLQLDMKDGVYDTSSETIVGPGGGPFTLYAILSPKATWSQDVINYFLGQTYYISVAVTPAIGPAPADLGSFVFQGSNVDVSADMIYGTPPVETLSSYDTGDLENHQIYPTFFQQFSFQFQSADKALTYDSALTPGGPTPSTTGGSYYATFTGDTSLLNANYELHFDTYNTMLLYCAGNADSACRDLDVDIYALFSHDAQTSHEVPEPTTMAGMMVGLAGVGAWRRRQGRKGN
jgi:hypothetical protein